MARILAGRDAESVALRDALAAVNPGPGRVILVAGEAGSGKTTLVEHVLAEAGVTALRGQAAQWATPAYDVIARALRPAVRSGATPALGVLAQVMPELGAPPPEPDLDALASSVCSLLADGDPGRPVVLFLDDLQWADEATLGLLPALADAAGRAQAAAIGCYRSDELPRGHRLRTVRAQLRRTGRLTEIELVPLDDEDVRRMLTELLGGPPQPTLTALVASRADGLPFAVEELAFALRDGGRLTHVDGTVTLIGAGATPVPDGVREAVLLRTARLSEEERTLLSTAAVAGNDFDVDTVLAVSGVASWPDVFTGSGLLTEAADGRAAFRHALTREAAYAEIPWARRRQLHRALAGTLAGGGAAPALIAEHLLAARDFEPARHALIAAAEEYCAVYAYRDAARTLRIALEHWPADGEEDGRLAIVDRLARCAERCSEYADAVLLLRDLTDGHQRRGQIESVAATHRRLALVHELRGQWESALTEREAAAMAFAAAGLPAEAVIDRLAVATHLRSATSYAAAIATLNAAGADAKASGRTDLVLRVQGLRGNVLARSGQPGEGIGTLRTAIDAALAESLPDTAAELQQRLADSLEHTGDYRAATAAYASAYQYCDAHDIGATGELCRACASVVLFARGDWDRAVVVCEDVLAGAAIPHAHAVGNCVLGLVHAFRGADSPARQHLVAASVLATRIELAAVELIAAWGLCVLDDAAGAHREATDRGQQVLARHARTEDLHYGLSILPWLATYFAEQGLATETHRCASVLSEMAETTAQAEAVAALAHARGETLLSSDAPSAARELRSAATMFAQLGLPLAAVLAQRRAAAAAAGLGDQVVACELLHAAHDTAARLGARPLATACAAALGQLGDKPRHQATANGRAGIRKTAGLTGRELDVMLLVATGNTSKEIGNALFISSRTVEMHVQSSMLKLSCRTRAQAVRRLAELGVLSSGS